MPKNDNFIVIQGWMVNELQLKGNELLVYALIYGFSQDGESEFKGSANYIADWLGTSRMTVSRTINSLVDKKLIMKRPVEINGVIFNNYKVLYPVTKCYTGVPQNVTGGCNKMLQHNNSTHINTSNSSSTHPTVEEVRAYCEERRNNVDPQRFVDYYESNGWRVGKNPMKDWRACVRTWERSEVKPQQKPASGRFANYEQRDTNYDSLMDEMMRATYG